MWAYLVGGTCVSPPPYSFDVSLPLPRNFVAAVDERDTALFLTGGSEFSPVSDVLGRGFIATESGPVTDESTGSPLPPSIEALGYIYRFDSEISLTGNVPVRPTTWSKVKLLHR